MEFTDKESRQIKEELTEIEQTRILPPSILDIIYQKKLFKFISQSLGGRAMDLPNALRIFQETSSIDGNLGWAVTIGAGGGMFSPCFKEDVAKDSFSPENAVIAGSGFPGGKAVKMENGYHVNGEWKFCSGSPYATIFTANCIVENEGNSRILSFILNPDQVEIMNDWNAFGLVGTSSHSIKVSNQFVPAERTFSIGEKMNNFEEVVHQFPFVPFSEASFASVVLGIGKNFLDHVKMYIEKNKHRWGQGDFDKYQLVTRKWKTEMERWNNAERHFHRMIDHVWQDHLKGKPLAAETLEDFSLVCKKAASTVLTCAQNLFRYMGMEMIMQHTELNRIWRDLHTAAQHAFLIPYQENETIAYEINGEK
ncbi:acyl-CoA dehydrogenase [Gracilibacillus xinjiangensis]|uniref:Acyl-CoA dehydrogenase n=1 Tax=Gracilibacillus xinjiangensis TaxID=1193282 RepID=A0ABV8WRE2_9BACI